MTPSLNFVGGKAPSEREGLKAHKVKKREWLV